MEMGGPRIKIKIKPGYDIDDVRAVRKEFPQNKLQVDANSAYTFEDAEHLKILDEFNLLLIEQPLGHDDNLDHAKLQRELSTLQPPLEPFSRTKGNRRLNARRPTDWVSSQREVGKAGLPQNGGVNDIWDRAMTNNQSMLGPPYAPASVLK